MKSPLFIQFTDFFQGLGVNPQWAGAFNSICLFFGLILAAFIVNFITRLIISILVGRIVKQSKNKIDDVFIEKKVFLGLSRIFPALMIYFMISQIFQENVDYPFNKETIIGLIQSICYIFIIIDVLIVINLFLNTLHFIYLKMPLAKNLNLKGYFQAVKLLFTLIAIIMIISVLTQASPAKIFTGLGAAMAVLILVFKDTILGFVACIQLSVNKMLMVGDWIYMPLKNADGRVTEISINTVKVLNHDHTMTMIPTFLLVSDSFVNKTIIEKHQSKILRFDVDLDVQCIKKVSSSNLNIIHSLNKYLTEEQKIEKIDGLETTNLSLYKNWSTRFLKQNSYIDPDQTIDSRSFFINNQKIHLTVSAHVKFEHLENYEYIKNQTFEILYLLISELELKLI